MFELGSENQSKLWTINFSHFWSNTLLLLDHCIQIEMNNCKKLTVDNCCALSVKITLLCYQTNLFLGCGNFKAFMTHKQFFFCNYLGLTAVLPSVSYFSVSKGINSDFNMMPAMKLMWTGMILFKVVKNLFG